MIVSDLKGVREAVNEDLKITDRVVIPDSELRERFSRSSGPGGQGVNTTDSRVELSFDVERSHAVPEDLRNRLLEQLAHRLVNGVLTVTASEHRAQLSNREAARARLTTLLREALAPPPPPRRPTKMSKGAKQRRLDAKRHRSTIKQLRRSSHD